jgi:steroid delta-isomerase-like uncharacterized protein
MKKSHRIGWAAGVTTAALAGLALTGSAVEAQPADRHGGGTAANERVVEGFLADVLNGHHGAHVQRWWTSDGQFHAGTLGTTSGRDNVTGLLTAIVTAIPDLHASQQDIIAQGDRVVVRVVVTGTQKGALIGIPASNRPVSWDAVDVYRLQNGRIAEEWAAEDLTAILADTGTYKAPWIP